MILPAVRERRLAVTDQLRGRVESYIILRKYNCGKAEGWLSKLILTAARKRHLEGYYEKLWRSRSPG